MNIQPIDRTIDIYGALSGYSEAPGVRDKLSRHLNQLKSHGENDNHRLTVLGLTFLRQHDVERSR